MSETATLDDIVLHDIDRWQRTGYPWEAWARLRREAPVYWYDRPGIDPAWMVTRHADVRAVEADPTTFINGGPRSTPRPGPSWPASSESSPSGARPAWSTTWR